MSREMTVAQMLPLIEESIASGGVFTLYPKGESMLPLIRHTRDAVELCAPDGVEIGDIVLYRRDNGDFVLHRIIGEGKTGYILCGDNQCVKEPGIKGEQIIAKVCAVLRDGQRQELTSAEYRRYLRRLSARRLGIRISATAHALINKLKRN